MTRSKIGFKIHGDYLTNLVRDIWVEGEPLKALGIMEASFPTMSPIDRMAVCTGSKKLEGVNELALMDDNATTHNGVPIISLDEFYRRREAAVAEREAESLAKAEMIDGITERIPSPWGLVDVPCSMLEPRHKKTGPVYALRIREGETHEDACDRFARLFPKAVEEARSRTEALMAERRQRDMLRLAGMTDNQIDAVKATVFGEPALKPAVDRTMSSLNGWILPNGDFYPCQYFGHIALAEALGSREPDAEKTWVKISNSAESPLGVQRADVYAPPRGITQAQLDAIFVWVTKHGREMPENLRVL